MLLIVATMMFTLTLAFGSVSVHAATLKATAKKEISATAKKQYSKIKSYAKTTKYKITEKQKAGELKKAGKNAFSQEWTMTMKQKKMGAVIEVSVVNTYSKKAKKVTTKIHAGVSYEEQSFGEGEDLKNVSALKKFMKKLSTKKGFQSYTKDVVKNGGESFSANWSVYCKPCKERFPTVRDYLGHLCLSVHWGYVFSGGKRGAAKIHCY